MSSPAFDAVPWLAAQRLQSRPMIPVARAAAHSRLAARTVPLASPPRIRATLPQSRRAAARLPLRALRASADPRGSKPGEQAWPESPSVGSRSRGTKRWANERGTGGWKRRGKETGTYVQDRGRPTLVLGDALHAHGLDAELAVEPGLGRAELAQRAPAAANVGHLGLAGVGGVHHGVKGAGGGIVVIRSVGGVRGSIELDEVRDVLRAGDAVGQLLFNVRHAEEGALELEKWVEV